MLKPRSAGVSSRTRHAGGGKYPPPYDQICSNLKNLFLVWKSKLSEANNILFCDCLDKLKVSLTIVQVVTNVWNIMLFIIVPIEPNFSCEK